MITKNATRSAPVTLSPFTRILGVTVLLLTTLTRTAAAGPAQVGDLAPDWNLRNPDGKSWSSSDLKGNVVVMEFWATWCKTCSNNMPAVEAMIRDYKDDAVQVIAVNILENGDPVEYMSKRPAIEFAVDGDQLAKDLGVAGTPTAIVIDQEGKVAFRTVGASKARTEGLRAAVDDLLAGE